MIHDLHPYPAMKDSGVPWLGQIPSTWRVARNGSLFTQRNETGFADLPLLEVSLRTGVQVRPLDGTGRKQVMADRDQYKRARKGDLAYNMMRMWQGAVGVVPVDGLVSPAYVVARPFPGVQSRFFEYLFRTDAYMGEVDKFSRGIVKDRNRLYWENFKQMPSPVPPADEQAAIVRFLDHVGWMAGRFMRAKQRLIALLEEKSRGIMDDVLTKGLAAGIQPKQVVCSREPDVPQHWEVQPLHRVTDPARPIMYGIVLPGPNVDDGVFVVKGGNCEPGRLQPCYLSRTTHEIEARYARSRLRAGDIVFAIRGGVGAAEIVPPELAGANLTQDAARIAAGEGINPEWLLYAVRAPRFRQQVESQVVGATVTGINIRSLKRIEVAVPPSSEEQAEIVAYLEEATRSISKAREAASREMSLLREYRTRLTMDVVTGRVDVRCAVSAISVEYGVEGPLAEPADSDGAGDADDAVGLEEVDA